MTDEQRKLAEEMIKCNMYLVRDLEVNTRLRFSTYGKVAEIMNKTKKNITHGESAKNIYEMAKKLCKNKLLLDRIEKMKNDILISDIADVTMISHWNPDKKTQLEGELSTVEINTMVNLGLGMMSTAEAAEITGINKDTIKQACQDGRLLNIRKVGRGWQVNVEEVKGYWGIATE